MLRGDVPYRDFSVEYPPGALPVFVAPAVGNEGDADAYKRSFGVLMAACGVALLIALAFALSALGVSGLRFFAVLALAAIAPLLLGSVVLTRFDLWPTALTAAALAALVSGRSRLGHGLLGAGILAKIWPGVVVPLAVAYVWRTRGRREALVCLGVTAAVVAAVVLPFVVLSPHGVWTSFERQLSRPLQIESLGAALIVVRTTSSARASRWSRAAARRTSAARRRTSSAGRRACCSSRCCSRSGSCSRDAGARARSSCSSRRLPSWRSWRSARSRRRSSSSG